MNSLPFSYQPQTVVSIVGPTATGKTNYAYRVAQKLLEDYDVPVVALISADSRQVYQGLEIISGADIPSDFSPVEYDNNWQLSPSQFFVKKSNTAQIELHGVSCLQPNQEWSLALFQQFAHSVIKQTWKRHGAVIIVGGTGLYHTRLFSVELQEKSGPDYALRSSLESRSLLELQELLKQKSKSNFATMTPSDQANPRRLIRAIEQKQQTPPTNNNNTDKLVTPKQHLIVGMTDSIDQIEKRIAKRVNSRIRHGALAEVNQLIATYGNQPDLAIFSATGVKEIIASLNGQVDDSQLKELWTRRERQYAKRQITWWKKHSDVLWLQSDTLLAID